MYENLVGQSAVELLSADIKNNNLPRAILFSGDDCSGKLTTALETSRILSCKTPHSKFNCSCPSCLQQKALTASNIMLLGPRDCFLEISSAKNTFFKAYNENASYLNAARYLFLRSVRKLTMRFNGILWQGDNNLSKIGSLIEEINENLEILDFPRNLPDADELKKICDSLEKSSLKLESDYLYNSIPVSHIRNLENWAHIKSDEGRKTIIIENADRMQASVRNALLKILEEPPADCLFILLTSKRNAIMQTILSRVRTYNFISRDFSHQNEVINRVFHNTMFNGSINDYLLTFLPVVPSEIKIQSDLFFNAVVSHSIPDLQEIVKKCGNFKPRIEFRLFLHNLAEIQRKMMFNPAAAEASAQCMNLLRQCWDNVTLYNQNAVSALEILLRDMSVLNIKNGDVFKCALM